jgi:hypothetical protein
MCCGNHLHLLSEKNKEGTLNLSSSNLGPKPYQGDFKLLLLPREVTLLIKKDILR